MNEQQESRALVFVVHKHQANTLHYDFRLEIGGSCGPLRSPRARRWIRISNGWRCPRPTIRLSYHHFEGVLEEGQHGAGPVMIWDGGTYLPERERAKASGRRSAIGQQLKPLCEPRPASGMLKFRLYGHKREALVCPRPYPWPGKKESWLLIKHTVGYTQIVDEANTYDVSAATGRSLAEIAGSGQQKRNQLWSLQK